MVLLALKQEKIRGNVEECENKYIQFDVTKIISAVQKIHTNMW